MSNGRLARPVAYLFNQTSGSFHPREQSGLRTVISQRSGILALQGGEDINVGICRRTEG